MILPELSISKRHCRFWTDAFGQVLCKDLSTNGTFWNRTLIGRGESVVLSNGDSIWIRRNHRFVFQNFIKTQPGHHDPQIKARRKSHDKQPRLHTLRIPDIHIYKFLLLWTAVSSKILSNSTSDIGKVNVAIHRKSCLTLAVKIIDRVRFRTPQNSGGTNIEKEVAILQSIDHANIIAVVDVFKTPRNMYIFMQMLPGGDLFGYLVKNGPLSELEAKFATYQVLQALQHLHRLNISHRDLKPENLLLASAKKYARVVLTDFGMAREFDKTYWMSTMCGTYAYMAPEVLEVQFAESPGYSCAADCWSLGITLYVILTGAHPLTSYHGSEDEDGMRQAIYTRDIAFPRRLWKHISVEACTLIKNLLEIDPDERWTVDQALSSDWIQKDIGWLRHKYREIVLPHWAASSRLLGMVRHDASLRYDPPPMSHYRPDERLESCP
ncbi:Checkpoint kinase 2 [Mortierella alpina]|nr:Checkpoint kinase 2 [Mortierella alpina]